MPDLSYLNVLTWCVQDSWKIIDDMCRIGQCFTVYPIPQLNYF